VWRPASSKDSLIYLSKQRPSDPGYAELLLLSMTFGQSLAPRVCLCLPVKLVNSGDEDVTSPLSRSYRFPKIFKGHTVSRRTSGRVRSSAFSFLVLLPSEVRCVANGVNAAFHEHVYLSILCLFFLSGCKKRGSKAAGYGALVPPSQARKTFRFLPMHNPECRTPQRRSSTSLTGLGALIRIFGGTC
jgi:hypothetical protein